MIHGFAERSGEQARISSEVGTGTTMRLPRHLGEETGAETAPTKRRCWWPTRSRRWSRRRSKTWASRRSARPVRVRCAPGARVDLPATDVGLPGRMNGRQVAEAARAAKPGLKALFVTGHAENTVPSHGHLDPGMRVPAKPFALEAGQPDQ